MTIGFYTVTYLCQAHDGEMIKLYNTFIRSYLYKELPSSLKVSLQCIVKQDIVSFLNIRLTKSLAKPPDSLRVEGNESTLTD